MLPSRAPELQAPQRVVSRRLVRLQWLACALLPCAFALGCGGEESNPTPEPSQSVPLTALTFNVMCSFCGGGEYDSWDERLPYFQDIFQRYDADLLGLQELAFASEVTQMQSLLPGYSAVFYAAEDSAFAYPDSTILYRTERFELEDSGEFWLSPTPEVPSSIGFVERQVPRLVVWARLFDKLSQRPLYFATTHVDNNSPSQELSAPLVLERAAPWVTEAPLILLGDFNSKPTSAAYQLFTAEGEFRLVNAQELAASWGVVTNIEPPPDYALDDRIDHIFISHADDWSVERFSVDVMSYGPNARYASDHFPMAATLSMTPNPRN